MTDPRWPVAVRAAHCLRHDPVGLGGARLRARAGDARDGWLSLVAGRLPDPVRLHPDIGDDALFGGLDLAETLRLGRPVHRSGLIARHRCMILPMAERCAPGLAARLAQVLDQGGHCLLALDEGTTDEEHLPAALSDRLAMTVALEGLRAAEIPALAPLPDSPVLDEDSAARQVVEAATALGIASQRRPGLALRVARASAAVDGRAALTEADLAFAVATSLLPHATRLPQPPEERAEDEDAPEPPPEAPDTAEGDTDQMPLPDGDLLLEAALAVLPPDVLARLSSGVAPKLSGAGAGAKQQGNRRGRPLPPRAGRLDGRARIDLVATLRAAAPWQRLRGGGPGKRVEVRSGDIRLKRYESKSDRLVIFAVDASGSAAFARLAEVKGAVELLLAEAYARRDHVALISFRGEGAEVLLPPTRSLVRTKRALTGLPGGGGTPLAAGLRAALEMGTQIRGRGMDPAVVLLTDGRPNVALSGEAVRSEAIADARTMARLLRAQGLPALVIDAGNRPARALAELAAEMDAPYLPLPRADAQRVSEAVSRAL